MDRNVDVVIPEESWEQKKTDVHKYHVDAFVMGNDWEGKFDFLKYEGVEVVIWREYQKSVQHKSKAICLRNKVNYAKLHLENSI